MSFSNFNNVYILNQSNASRFQSRVRRILNKTTNDFLLRHQDQILKKDKKTLPTIIQEQAGSKAIGGIMSALNELWDLGFKAGENSTKGGDFSLASLADFVTREDVQDKIDSQESLKDELISTTMFGKDYLRYRNREVARNFTKEYTNQMFKSVSNYMNSPRQYPDTNIMLTDLGSKTPQELTDNERRQYDNWINGQRALGVDVNYPQVYGLKGEVIRDPRAYDSWKYDLENRINRIASTEASAAFNLGRLNTWIEKGYTQFIWETSPDELATCDLCTSKNGDIVRITDLAVSVHSYSNIGWTDYSKVYTEEDKNSMGSTPSGRTYDNTTALFPPIHPFCSCRLVPDEEGRRSRLEVMTEDVITKAKNIAKNVVKTIGITSAVGAVTFGAVTVAEEYLRIEEEMKMEEEGMIMWSILGASSVMAGGYLLFKHLTKHPRFVSNVVRQGVKVAKHTAEGVTANVVQDVTSDTVDAMVERYTEKVSIEREEKKEEKEKKALHDKQAYKDFINLGLSPVLAKELIEDLNKAENRANYHDLIATKLREYLFNKLSPEELGKLALLEKEGDNPQFWETHFGGKTKDVKRIVSAIDAHLNESAKTGSSSIVLAKVPAGKTLTETFITPSLQDIVIGGQYVFKDTAIGAISPTQAVDAIRSVHKKVNRELDWDKDERAIRNAFKGFSEEEVNVAVSELKRVFPGKRQNLPTGEDLVMRAEKLNPVTIPAITTKKKIQDLEERLITVATSDLVDTDLVDDLELEIINLQSRVERWGKNTNYEDLSRLREKVQKFKTASAYKNKLKEKELKIDYDLELVEYPAPAQQEEYRLAQTLDGERTEIIKNIKRRNDSNVVEARKAKKEVSKKIGYKQTESFKLVNDSSQFNNERLPSLIDSTRVIDKVEKELDDISRLWSDDHTYYIINYLDSSRHVTRSEKINQKILDLHSNLIGEQRRLNGLNKQKKLVKRRLVRQQKLLKHQLEKAKVEQADINRIVKNYEDTVEDLKNYRSRLLMIGNKKEAEAVTQRIRKVNSVKQNLVPSDVSNITVAIENDIRDVENLLRNFDNTDDYQNALTRIDDLLNNQLSIVKKKDGRKTVVGGNKYFPRKLEGDALTNARRKVEVYQKNDILKTTVRDIDRAIKTEIRNNTAKLDRVNKAVTTELTKHRNIIENEEEDYQVSAFTNQLVNTFNANKKVSDRLLIDLDTTTRQAQVALNAGDKVTHNKLKQQANSIAETLKRNDAVKNAEEVITKELKKLGQLDDRYRKLTISAKKSRDESISKLNKKIQANIKTIRNSDQLTEEEKSRLITALNNRKAEGIATLDLEYSIVLGNFDTMTAETTGIKKKLRQKLSKLRASGVLQVDRNETMSVNGLRLGKEVKQTNVLELTGEKNLSSVIQKFKSRLIDPKENRQ